MKGEYPVAKGLTISHEPVGVIEKLGSAVVGSTEGQRVIAGTITPSGWSSACLCGYCSQDGAGTKHGWKPMGGWKFGNTIDGCQAEYVLVPDAMANLAPMPDGLTDEQVLMCPDIMSTGFSGAERGRVRIGDAVAVFAQGPIGLCATVGARERRDDIIAVDRVAERLSRGGSGRTTSSTSRRSIPWTRACASPMAGASMWPLRRWALRRRSKPRFVSCGQGDGCRVLASIQATSRYRSVRSLPGSVTTPS